MPNVPSHPGSLSDYIFSLKETDLDEANSLFPEELERTERFNRECSERRQREAAIEVARLKQFIGKQTVVKLRNDFEVHVRELTEDEVQALRKEFRYFGIMSFPSRLVAYCATNETGVRIFRTESDVERLSKLPIGIFLPIYHSCLKINPSLDAATPSAAGEQIEAGAGRSDSVPVTSPPDATTPPQQDQQPIETTDGPSSAAATTLKGSFGLTLYPESRRAGREERSIQLSNQKVLWDILVCLATTRREFYHPTDLAKDATSYESEESTIWNSVSRLRKKLKPIGLYIKNSRELGYQLTLKVSKTSRKTARRTSRKA